jgi:hypothetical protein
MTAVYTLFQFFMLKLQVTGGMLQSTRDVENPLGPSHRNMQDEERAVAIAVGTAMVKARVGNEDYLTRPSEMVEVPSESARVVDDLNENYEEEPESISSGSNKCTVTTKHILRIPSSVRR